MFHMTRALVSPGRYCFCRHGSPIGWLYFENRASQWLSCAFTVVHSRWGSSVIIRQGSTPRERVIEEDGSDKRCEIPPDVRVPVARKVFAVLKDTK